MSGELAAVLAATLGYVTTYVRFPSPHEAVAVVLWIMHTWTIDAAEQSPYLGITSVEKRSGKSRLFEILELLVRRAWRAITPSEAVLYRKLEQDHPTLLLDEVDALWATRRSAEQNEDLRGLLNAGNRRGTTVPRCVIRGKETLVEEFDVFGAKALAGIGDLPETIADRSIAIRMERRTRNEPVERFRLRDAAPLAAPIRERIEAVAPTIVEALSTARPLIPDQLGDRAADSWEPLLAIAEMAGETWTERARAAAVALSGERIDDMDDASLPLLLLSDLREVFTERGADRLLTVQVIEDLVSNEERPWGDLGRDHKPITAHGIGRLLRGYRVRPVRIRLGGRDSKQARGYLRADLEPVWDRYLPPVRHTPSDRHTVTPDPFASVDDPTDDPSCDGVTLETPVTHGGADDATTPVEDDYPPSAWEATA